MKTHLNPPCEGGLSRVGLITENDYDPTRSTRDR